MCEPLNLLREAVGIPTRNLVRLKKGKLADVAHCKTGIRRRTLTVLQKRENIKMVDEVRGGIF